MDVTRDNFVDALAILRANLPNAHFVAVDLEFTGLGEHRPSQLDTPSVRYQSASADAERFPPVQVGVALFKRYRRTEAREGGEGQVEQRHCDDVHVVARADVQMKDVEFDHARNAGPGGKGGHGSGVGGQDGACVDGEAGANANGREDGEKGREDALGEKKLGEEGDKVSGGKNVQDELEEGQLREDKVGKAASEKVEWEWQVIPFNFNVFPRAFYFPPNARYPTWDRVFNLQSSTVQFLLRHGFDFMKIFSEGVTWVREDVEKDIREHVESLLKKMRADRSKAVPKTGKKVIAKYRKLIDDWLATLDNETGIRTLPFPKEALQRRLIFDFVKDEYPKIHADIFLTQDGQALRLTKFADEAQVAEKAKQAFADNVDMEVSKAIGFRYVVDAIREARVPVVAHNALLDWIKIYANFVKPAPAQHVSFKHALREVFPFVYDTRWMLHVVSERFQGLGGHGRYPSIKDLTETVQKFVKQRGSEAVQTRTFVPTSRVYRGGQHLSKGFLRSKEEGFVFSGTISDGDIERDIHGFGRYSAVNSERYEHEAGYDALQTGKLFALLLQLLESDGSTVHLDRDDGDSVVRNKIWLGSCGGYKIIDLETEDQDEPNPYLEKGNAIVITGKLKEDKQSKTELVKTSAQARLKRSLGTILDGTAFDPLKSQIIIAGPETLLVLLEREQDQEQRFTGKRKDGLFEIARDVDGVIERGKQLGLHVERYENAIGHVDPTIKRRRCA